MRLMHLSISTLIWRFYLIMAVILVAGFTGLWLLALIALPIFFSCLLGIEFKKYQTIAKPRLKQSPGQVHDQHEAVH